MHIQRTNILAPAIAALAIAAFLLMQDRQGTVYPEALLRADSIVSKQPDSAAVILDGLEHGMASAPEAVRMRYRLIRQKQIAYSFGRFTSDSAARALVEYYETRGERSRLPEAYYYAGKTYMSLNDSPMAMEYFFKTLDAAAESDLNLRGRTYSQLGYIFDRQWLDSEALGMFKKAYRCSSKTNDTVSMIFSLRDMGGMYVDLSKPDSALACYNKALALAEASHDKPMAITVTGQLARFYSQQGDYEMAFKCLNKVIGEDSCWDRGSIAGIAAKWYEANGKPDSAIMLYKEVADIGTVYTKADAYKALAEHYLAQKNQKEAALCLTNYKKAIDSIQGITTTEAIKQTSNLREYRFRESEFRRLRQKNKEQRAIMAILATIGSVATLALAFLSVYLRRKRNLQSMKLGRRKTGKASEPGHEAGNGMKDSLMHSEEIYKSIMLMVNNPNAKKKITEEMWAELSQAVNRIYPGFDENLYSLCKMSTFDYRICLLIKIKIQPSHIAAMANLSTSGVSTLRSKLFMRAFGKKGRSSDWDDIINSL